MQRTRTAVAASVLALLSVAALGACSGSDASDDGSDAKSAPSTAPEKKTQDPAAELGEAALGKSEVSGYTVRKPDQKFAFAGSKDQVKVDKAACAPLAYAMNQFPLGTPKADLTRVASSGGKTVGAFTYVSLAAYGNGGGDAKAAFAGLTKAVGACGAGFTAKGGQSSTAYDSVAPETAPVPAGADESTAFKATTRYEGVTHTMRTQAVRHGDTLAVYFAVDGMALVEKRSGDAKVAAAVLKAQNAKLG
ncbi:hypothetical protein [Streptomyces sp. NPDC087300]|uniref:hypothetical protein n=1 Tax=Streptomyces sp. NPDC087300 TaxID=3365780 RepID=UPI0038165463